MKFFNTAGPVKANKHYCLDPLARINLDEVMTLIQQEKYFVLHAPRQTGKTSMLLALTDKINREGHFHCLYVNVEAGQTAREDVAMSQDLIVSMMGRFSENYLNDSFLTEFRDQNRHKLNPHAFVFDALTAWTKASSKPIVLLIDEIDALIGDSLVSILRQLRSGYAERPESFPQSIILCGVRDIRDYRIYASSENEPITGGSAFNVKAKSLRMGNFNEEEVKTLLSRHTVETGQKFTAEAQEAIWSSTKGQPWLVNALAYEVTWDMKANRDTAVTITAEMVQQARENLILRRETHLDQLVDKLKEPRVHRVIAPILEGADISSNIPDDDVTYVHDLGLIETHPKLSIANPIYREVIPRTLIWTSQLTISHDRTWYMDPVTGMLNIHGLLTAFQQFYRENIEFWAEHHQYKEAGPQLLLQAFLQRVINGGGRIEREYGLGKGRTDLLILFPYKNGMQRVVLELKIRKGTRQATIEKAMPQITGYMDRCGSRDGHLIIFDQTEASWDEKIFHDQTTHEGITVQVWGM